MEHSINKERDNKAEEELKKVNFPKFVTDTKPQIQIREHQIV